MDYGKWKKDRERYERWGRISNKVVKWQFAFLVCILPYLDSVTTSRAQHLTLIVLYPLSFLIATPWRLIFRALDRFVPKFHGWVERLRLYREQLVANAIQRAESYFPELPEDDCEYEDPEEPEKGDGQDRGIEACTGTCGQSPVGRSDPGSGCESGLQQEKEHLPPDLSAGPPAGDLGATVSDERAGVSGASLGDNLAHVEAPDPFAHPVVTLDEPSAITGGDPYALDPSAADRRLGSLGG